MPISVCCAVPAADLAVWLCPSCSHLAAVTVSSQSCPHIVHLFSCLPFCKHVSPNSLFLFPKPSPSCPPLGFLRISEYRALPTPRARAEGQWHSRQSWCSGHHLLTCPALGTLPLVQRPGRAQGRVAGTSGVSRGLVDRERLSGSSLFSLSWEG